MGHPGIEGRERDVVDRCGFARDAVVVHGIDAVGRDVHLKARAAGRGEDTFDGNAAQGQVFGELGVGDGKLGKVGAQPLGEDIHRGLSSSIRQPEAVYREIGEVKEIY